MCACVCVGARVCVCVCVCVRVCERETKCVCVCVFAFVCAYLFVFVYVCVLVRASACTRISKFTHDLTFTCRITQESSADSTAQNQKSCCGLHHRFQRNGHHRKRRPRYLRRWRQRHRLSKLLQLCYHLHLDDDHEDMYWHTSVSKRERAGRER